MASNSLRRLVSRCLCEWRSFGMRSRRRSERAGGLWRARSFGSFCICGAGTWSRTAAGLGRGAGIAIVGVLGFGLRPVDSGGRLGLD